MIHSDFWIVYRSGIAIIIFTSLRGRGARSVFTSSGAAACRWIVSFDWWTLFIRRCAEYSLRHVLFGVLTSRGLLKKCVSRSGDPFGVQILLMQLVLMVRGVLGLDAVPFELWLRCSLLVVALRLRVVLQETRAHLDSRLINLGLIRRRRCT